MSDKLAIYLREEAAHYEQEQLEIDRHINLLFMRNFKNKPKTKTKK